MSSPISAIITCAAVGPAPGISSSRSTVWAKGAISSAILASTAAMSAPVSSIRASMVRSRKAWWSVKCPTNASSSTLILARIRARASWASTFGSRSPAINAASISPAGDPEDVRDHRGQLDLGVLEHLLHPVLLRRAGVDQVQPIPGQVTQPADLYRGHEARAQHLPLGDLAQPHRVELVGLGPAG